MNNSNANKPAKPLLVLAAAALIAAPALSLPSADAAAASATKSAASTAAPAADKAAAASKTATPAAAAKPAANQSAAQKAAAAKAAAADAAAAAKDPFGDILKDPNRAAIITLFENEIVMPAADRKFRPSAEIGRADFTVILGRAMDANGSVFDVKFTDPIPDWAIRYVGGLSAAGVYDGYLVTNAFGPKSPVTRAEAAAMVARAAHLEPVALPSGLGGAGNIPVWARDDVGAAYAAGLIPVTSSGTLNPNKKVTRSEMAAMIAPMYVEGAFLPKEEEPIEEPVEEPVVEPIKIPVETPKETPSETPAGTQTPAAPAGTQTTPAAAPAS
ncbi:S-layer homology domain-containing protein [Saccharibacillus sp. CPCC 101409]|uniref:S-layer homology domain-containing protein n=1 Tax=Saccharibacillus sp. CPCC 101409 TaxID=3058041 RepID=UPI002673782D|nr:S-layer homology domain-containing protein [Saccharibacillus sp. CPCC 101409]MDO3408273.1 S-layer homology domain-containing protein [Saccharibacillus sp. CPCC 101409]